MTDKINLLGLPRAKLSDFFQAIGEKSFRAEQLMKWIHYFGITDFAQMSNFSKALQAKLAQVAHISLPQIDGQHFSQDGTCKWAIKVASGSLVETVYIPQNGRGTLCVSSQAGCTLDCSFCATGKQGFNSNLTSSEIIGQVFLAQKSLRKYLGDKRIITNVVFMGMGEPLLNFANVIDAVNIMLDDFAYGISKRKVTLSTSGYLPVIDKLADFTDVALALSLHAPNNELRSELVPLNRKYPIEQVLNSCQKYIAGLGDKRFLTIEYTLIKGVNDGIEHAKQLAQLLRDFPCKINLIAFNPFTAVAYKRPSNNEVYRFRDYLYQQDFNVTIRNTRGDDINAACGQLAGNILDKTKRSMRYIKAKQIAVGEI